MTVHAIFGMNEKVSEQLHEEISSCFSYIMSALFRCTLDSSLPIYSVLLSQDGLLNDIIRQSRTLSYNVQISLLYKLMFIPSDDENPNLLGLSGFGLQRLDGVILKKPELITYDHVFNY